MDKGQYVNQNNLKSILIVEDDEGLNKLLRHVIENEGYITDGALTGQEVIEKVAKQAYFFLLLDYELADMSGDQLIEALKAKGIDIPFIVITGQGNEQIAVRMMKLGARDYLVKEGNYLKILPHILNSYTIEIDAEIKYRQAQQQLKESDEKYRSLVENSIMGVSITYKNRFEFVNRALIELLGYDCLDSLSLLPPIDHVYPDDRPMLMDIVKRVFKEQTTFTQEIRLLCKDHSCRDFIMIGAMIDIHGEQFLQSSFFDITDRRLVEEKLKIKHEQLLSIYESITEPIFVTDLETYEVIFSNSAFREHFGEVKNVKCYENIHQVSEPCVYCPIPCLQQQDIQAYYWEYQNEVNKHWYRCVDKIIQWPDGKNVHFQLAFDISGIKLTENELIKAKEKAEAADRLKTAFLANMSHEIRTPMNAIIGFTDILLKQEFDIERQKEYLTIVQQRSNDLLQIINDILDISSIEVGQIEIIESAGNLAEIFREVFQFYETRENLNGTKKPIEFKQRYLLTSKQSYVITDFARVKQIIHNLLDNAFKFTQSGKIEFGCKLTERKEILIFVKDTGIGIAPEMQPDVFNYFMQVDGSSLTRKTGGTGLGLSISKGLVEILKGAIWVESVIDQGTTVYFTIPYKTVSQLDEISADTAKSYQWNDKTILIVEDDTHNTTLITEYLDKTGIRCLYAKKGSEAMDLFYKEPSINLILMDIRLPDASGLELTKLMKASKPDCIIVAQTAYAFDNDKEMCLSNGCNDYITKPLNKIKLLELVDYYLNVHSVLIL